MSSFWIIIIFGLVACNTKGHNNSSVPENKQSSLAVFDQAIASDPKDPLNFLNRARAQMEAGNNESAIEDLSKAIVLDSNLTESYFLRAKLLYKGKKYLNALKDLKECYKANKKDKALNKMIAQIYLYLGKHKEAISFSNKLLKLDIHNEDAYFIKAYAYKELGDTVKAISTFQTALEQKPDMYKAHMQLGLLYSAQKNSLALDYFETASKLRPDVLNPIYATAIFYQENNQAEKAKKIYKGMVLTDNQYEKAYYNLGYIYMGQDSLEKAKRMLTLAIKISPYYTDAYYNRGLCSEKQNNLVQAIKDYKQTINFEPDHFLANKALVRLKANQ